jgi:RNA polymerase sigma-70 factor (ECF subfamily)
VRSPLIDSPTLYGYIVLLSKPRLAVVWGQCDMSTKEKETEEELVRNATCGDRMALQQLLLLHYTPLARRISATLPPALQGSVGAEDILQETFIHAIHDIGGFDPLEWRSFGAWLMTVADNRIRDAIKRSERKKRGGHCRRARNPRDDHGSSIVDLIDILAADSKTPSRSVARDEAVKAIQVAVASLPEDYRQAVRLRYLEGMRLSEVATAMRRSPGAIRGLLDRAKQQLRDALGRASDYLSRS